MTARIQVRRGTAVAWAAANPILALGEFGFETDTNALKMGDGVTAWNSLVSYIAVGGWTSYTPTFAQGASTNIAKTVNYAKSVKQGRLVTGTVKVSSTATGTAGSGVTISAPYTAATSGIVCGSGFFNDGGTQYQAVAYLLTTTTIALLRTDVSDTSTDDPIGLYPNIAVASGDVFSVHFTYEAAA